MKSEDQLIPKSIFKKFFKNFSQFIGYLYQFHYISNFYYNLLFFIYLIQIFLSSFIIGNQLFWNNLFFLNIFNFFENFFNFGFFSNNLNINLLIILFFIFLIIIFYSLNIYFKITYLKPFLGKFLIFLFDIFLLLFQLLLLKKIIFIYFENKNLNKILILLIIFILLKFFLILFIDQYPIYLLGKSITWIPQDLIKIKLIIELEILNLNLLKYLNNKSYLYLFILIYLIFNIFQLLKTIKLFPFIKNKFFYYYCLFHYLTIFTLILILIQIFLNKINIFLFLFLILLLFYLINLKLNYYLTKKINNINELFDIIENDSLENIFKNSNLFLCYLRMNFKNGKKDFLNLNLLNDSIKIFGNQENIFLQYLLFFIIYPEEKLNFDNLLKFYKKLYSKKILNFFFINLIKTISKNRIFEINSNINKNLNEINLNKFK